MSILNQKKLLSIIIPVYNVEVYIGKLLQSIFSQNTEEVEIIVVNDGTLDGSMNVVQRFVLAHPNLYIVNQSNMGLSEARNTGLKHAKGRYVWFVDGDDSISADCLDGLRKLLVTADMDVWAFDVIKVKVVNKIEKEETDKLCYKRSQYRFYNKVLKRDDIVGVLKEAFVQRFVFRKKFLDTNGLRFFPGIYHEDNEFMPRAMFYARNIMFVEKAYYRYLIRGNGNIMSSKSVKHIKDRLLITDNLLKFKRENARSLSDRCFMDFYIFSMIRGLIYEQDDFGTEGHRMVRVGYRRFRLLGMNAVAASLYYRLPKSLIKACAMTINPSWVRCLEKRIVR